MILSKSDPLPSTFQSLFSKIETQELSSSEKTSQLAKNLSCICGQFNYQYVDTDNIEKFKSCYHKEIEAEQKGEKDPYLLNYGVFDLSKMHGPSCLKIENGYHIVFFAHHSMVPCQVSIFSTINKVHINFDSLDYVN